MFVDGLWFMVYEVYKVYKVYKVDIQSLTCTEAISTL